MPLSKKRNRDRMRALRATCVQPSPVQPEAQGVKNKTIANLCQMVKNIENRDKVPQRPLGEASLPLYNPSIHKPGDRVLMKPLYGKRLVETVIPMLDADGNPMPE